jgi:hypothetical protein
MVLSMGLYVVEGSTGGEQRIIPDIFLRRIVKNLTRNWASPTDAWLDDTSEALLL